MDRSARYYRRYLSAYRISATAYLVGAILDLQQFTCESRIRRGYQAPGELLDGLLGRSIAL